MKITFKKTEIKGTVPLAVAVYETGELSETAKKIDKLASGMISCAIKTDKFTGKAGESLTVRAPLGLDCERVICVGMGKRSEYSPLTAQYFGAKVAAVLRNNVVKEVKICVDDDFPEYAAFGAYLAMIKNVSFKTDNASLPKLNSVVVKCHDFAKADAAYKKELSGMAKAIETARCLVSLPANAIYPEKFAEIAVAEQNEKLKVTVYGEKELKKLGMDLLLAVGQGAAAASKMVVMEYKGGAKDGFDIALVGKGVCFDSGGISLKPARGMEDMKYDMAGAAAVMGTMMTLASRGAKVNAVAVMGLVENMPSATAVHPGDVIKSMSGKTVEIVNTDAEGRLVLADLLTFVQQKLKVKKIIELSTLTGAIIVALGKEYAGVFTDNESMAADLVAAGKKTGEKVWPMPSSSEYAATLKSEIADIKNMGVAGEAGSIAAAEFLKKFVDDKSSFAHIDIAGSAMCDRSKYDFSLTKGATGFGIRLLNRYIKDNIEKGK